MDVIETLDGFTVRLEQDDDAQSPIDCSDDDESGTVFIVTTINRYFEQRDPARHRTPEEAYEYFGRTHHIFPLIMYAHSGVALSLHRDGCFGDAWDAGQVGFVLVKRDRDNGWHVQAKAREAAAIKVEEWNQYLSGDIWGFIVENPDGENVDSCWGHYGRKWAEEAAKDALNCHVAYFHKTETEAARIMAL